MQGRTNKLGIALVVVAALAAVPTGTKQALGVAASCPDNDADGFADMACGGSDCDDADGTRYPGAPEVCDAAGHDEDCNPGTVGNKDDDRDGEIDFRCMNHAPDGTTPSGTDVDDSNPAIQSGAQVCNGGDQVYIYWGVKNGSWSQGAGVAIVNCPAGTKCIPQPNKTGVCGTPPPGYTPPPTAPQPTPPASRPPLPSAAQLLSAIRPKKAASTLAPVRAPLPLRR
jgi:Putative metal-binding motif